MQYLSRMSLVTAFLLITVHCTAEDRDRITAIQKAGGSVRYEKHDGQKRVRVEFNLPGVGDEQLSSVTGLPDVCALDL